MVTGKGAHGSGGLFRLSVGEMFRLGNDLD